MAASRWAGLLAGARYIRGVSRAVRRGETFPEAGRSVPSAAPGGSESDAIRRFRLDERWDFQVTRHRVPVVGLERPVRVLQLSDVHLRGPEPWVDELCRRIRALRPDLVALTGDVVTRGFEESVASCFLDAVPAAPLGRFAVIGNWEVWGGAPRVYWEPFLARHGIPLLHDRSVDVGPITVIGTDDALSGSPDVEAAFRDAAPDKPALVLTHSPVLFPALARRPACVVLAGHTHGGQVNLPGIGPFFLPRGSGVFPWAWYERDGVWMYVNRGLGWSVAPWRWRSPPEIAWIELVPA